MTSTSAPTPLHPQHRLLEKVVLAAAGAAGTGAVMAWAGAGPGAALLGAAAAAAVVVVAAQLAGSLPGAGDGHRATGTTDREP